MRRGAQRTMPVHSRYSLVALLLLVQVAHAAPVWGPANRDEATQVQGSGDPVTPAGAAVVISAQTAGPQGFIGSMTAVDVAAFRGRTVELTATLRVAEGAGSAAVWLRADGPDGSLAFANTGQRPVLAADGARERVIRLYIPVATRGLKLGTTLRGTGTLEATSIKLGAVEASPGEVSAHAVLHSAIGTMQANALNADRVDWASERARLLVDDLKSAPAPEAYARIASLLDMLGDRHSFLQPPAAAAEYRKHAIATDAMASHVSDGVGYLLVPGLRGTDAAAGRTFSAGLCGALSTTAPRGWIVDLRRNGGGNMWPMIAGLRPLLGAGTIGSFKSRVGGVTAWQSKPIDGCSLDLSASPVAVLVGASTASSGEAVAVAFKGRDHTRFFGQPTAGLATSNQGFPLPDGSMLMLTTAVFVDRAGSAYGDGITPDIRLGVEDDLIGAARGWLISQGH